MAQPHPVTLTGGLVHFQTDMDGLMQITGSGNITVCGKNLWDGSGVISAWLNENTQTIESLSGGYSIYLPIKGGETYTISKVKSLRLCVSTTYDVPAIGVSLTTNVINHNTSGNPITITTNPTDRYLIAFVYRGSSESMTKEQVFATVQVEVGSHATTYAAFNGTTAAAGTARKSLVGINNVWSDSGNVTVTYWTH